MKFSLEKYEPLVKQAINQNQENTVSSQYKPLVSDSIDVSKDTGIVPIKVPDLPVSPISKITTAVTPSMYQMNALPGQTQQIQPVKTNSFDLSGNDYVQQQPVQPVKTGSFDGSGANYVAPTQPLNKQTVIPDYSGLTRDVPKENVNPYSADESMYILEKMGNGFATLPNMIPRIIGFAGENIATFNPLNDVNKVTLDMFGDKLTSEEKKVLQDKVNKTEQKDAKTEEYWNKVLKYQIVQDRNAKIDEKYKGKDISKDAQFAADVSVGAINMLPQTVLAYFSGGGSYALMFADSAAQGKIEALNDGATDDQATTYGYLKGAIEIGTEMLSGGIPGVPDGKGIASTGLLDPLVKNPMKKIAKTELGKEVVETVIEYLGEGAEEYLSEVLGNYAKSAYDQNKVKSFNDIQDQAIYAFWTGAFTSVLMEAGRIGAVKIANDVVNSNVKAVEDLSKPEQLQYTKNLLAKSNTNLIISDTYQGKDITNSSGLYDPKNNVVVIPTETYNNGNILTTSIMHEFTHAMEVSGNYQKVRESILDFLDKNGRLEPLRKDIENRYPNNTDIDGEVVADFIQDNFFKRVIKKDGEYQTYTNFADLNAFIMDLDTKEKGLFKKVLGGFLKSHTQGELTAKYDALIKEYEKAQKNNDIKRIKELQPAIDRVFTQLDLTNNAQYFKSLELSFNSAIEYANTHEDLQFDKKLNKNDELKNKQFEIISNTNPAPNDVNTWIRSINDIKTFEELFSPENFEQIDPDFTQKMANKALETGNITVYSSYPIEQGIFVSPSKMEAQSYSGNGNIYSKEVGINDVAWIAQDQGQYANVNEYKFKLKPETNLNEVNKEVKDETKTAVSKTYSTVVSSGVIKNEALGKMQELLNNGEIVHEVKTDKKSLDKAISSIDGKYKQSYDQIKALFDSGKAIGKDDVVVAEVLLEKFGRKDATKADQMRALELTMMLTTSGTNAGQYIQSLNMIKKMGGVGQLMYYERLAQKYNKQYSKYNKDFTVSDELKLEMLNAKGEEEIKTVSEKIANEMIDKMPSTALDKVTTWQMMAMLSNPATDVRNVMSNVFMASMAELKDINAGLLEMNLPKEQRTKSLVLDKGAWKFAKEIYEQNKDIVLNSGTFDMTKNLEHQKRIFKTEVLEKYKNVRFNLLEWEDSLFKSWAFKRVFAQEMTAKGLTKDTITPVQLNELIQKASKEATIRTFQEASAIANGLNRFAKQNAVAGVAIQSILPFKRTPINIAKQGFEYSPAGLIKDVLVAKNNLETGKWDKTQFFDKLGSGLAGTEMAALGFLLYSLGVISIGKDDDESKRMADYNRSLGVTDFSLHIGDKYYTIDWITPTIIPFMMGAELNRLTSKGNKKLDEVALQALADTFNPMFELTLLRGLSSAISSYETDGVGKVGNILSTMASNYATQFVPSALGSVAKTLDETKRTTYTGQGILADTIAKIKSKVPILAEQNAPVIDVKGQEVKQIGDWWLRGLQNFLSPTKVTQDITDKTDIEIKRLYDSTGESSIIPQMPPSKLTYNSENYDLSADEKTTYAETYGQTSYNLLTDLFNNELYAGLSDEEKTKVVSDAYNYAKSLAKGEVITGRNISYTDTSYNKIREAERNGIEVTEYLIMKNRFDNIKSSEDFSKKEQIIAELVYSGKSDDEIYQYLVYVGGYEYSSSDQKYIDILRSVK